MPDDSKAVPAAQLVQLKQALRKFKRRDWATVKHPAHKSDLNALSSQYACQKKWWYEQRELEAGRSQDDDSRVVWGRTAIGTATHEAIAWFLTNPVWVERVLRMPDTTGYAGGQRVVVTLDQVKRVYFEMFDRAVGTRPLEWKAKDKAQTLHEDRMRMIYGVLNRLHLHVAKVELVEAGFIFKLGDYCLSGHVDLVYRPRLPARVQPIDATLGLADWKTGQSKPDQLELDHGWESGVYSAALRHGMFLRREAVTAMTTNGVWTAHCLNSEATHVSRYRAERTAMELALQDLIVGDREALGLAIDGGHLFCFEKFPSEIQHVHLGDYVPYKRAGKRTPRRPEELRYFGLNEPKQIEYIAGDLKGPAWIPIGRTEHDIPRLLHRMRTVVAGVRLNVFPDLVGEHCRRCPFAKPCLTSGYAPTGVENDRLESLLREAGSDAQQDLTLD